MFNGANDRKQRRIKIENIRQNFRTNIRYLSCKYKGDKIISLRKKTHIGSKDIVHKKYQQNLLTQGLKKEKALKHNIKIVTK